MFVSPKNGEQVILAQLWAYIIHLSSLVYWNRSLLYDLSLSLLNQFGLRKLTLKKIYTIFQFPDLHSVLLIPIDDTIRFTLLHYLTLRFSCTHEFYFPDFPFFLRTKHSLFFFSTRDQLHAISQEMFDIIKGKSFSWVS